MRREDLIHLKNNCIYSFEQFETTIFFVKNIHEGKITLDNADNKQDSLLLEIGDFNKEPKASSFSKKKQKRDTQSKCTL